MEVTEVLISILAALSAVTSPYHERYADDVCFDEVTGGIQLDRSTSANVSSIVPDDNDTCRQSQQVEKLQPESGLLVTTSLKHSAIGFRPVCSVRKRFKLRRAHRSKVEDTCTTLRCAVFLQADGLCHRNTSTVTLDATSAVTLDASLCEVFQECEIVPPVKLSGHTQWRHDDNEGNDTVVNENGFSCIAEDDPEMAELATPVIFGCLVLFYIGHLAVLMVNIADGGIGGLKRCSVCSMNVAADDAGIRWHRCMGDCNESDEFDENDYCNDSSYKSDPDYFEYSYNNETDDDDRSLGDNVDDFFDVTDDDFSSVYYNDSVSNEIINTDDEECVEEGSGADDDAVNDGDYDSYDTLNDESDDENCYGSSDNDTNSWQ